MWRPSARVDFTPRTAVSGWYSAGPRPTIQKQTLSQSSHHASLVHSVATAEMTAKKKKKYEHRSTSDDTDTGVCWSDYERVPGTKPGEKGSCRPKRDKKKKKKEGKKG